MNVCLTPELEKRVAEKVDSGLYASASEVIRESLRLLFETEELHERRLDRLRSEVRLGLDQLDRGEGIPGKHVLAQVNERLESRRNKR